MRLRISLVHAKIRRYFDAKNNKCTRSAVSFSPVFWMRNLATPGLAEYGYCGIGWSIEETLMNRCVRNIVLTFLAAGMTVAGVMPIGAAPAAATNPDSRDDLRAAVATTQDIAEGKRVAEASCAGCHGLNGIAKAKDKDNTPHIAGQRPGYLYMELRAYQSGGRRNGPMNNAVKFLSDDALVKVAAYYTNLDPAQPVSGTSSKTAPAKSDPVSIGRAAAAGCAGCHGESGISSVAGMPNLVGLDPKFFVASVKAYKSGERKHDMMKTLVSALTDAELDSLALFTPCKSLPRRGPRRQAIRQRARPRPTPAPVAMGKAA
ncbi:MAG: c-type cytochrome [Pseudomonadota bacterium]